MPKPAPPSLDVLYEDNHLLVINKPAGLATQGVGDDEVSAVKLAKEYLKRKYQKPGNVFVGVVSRLDAQVSGVLVLARTSKAAARLSEQFRERQTRKIYWAVVDKPPKQSEATLTDWLKKDEKTQRMVVTTAHAIGAQKARLSYRELKRLAAGTLLEIELETGRKHQIRVQLAYHGTPILGDRKYGSRRPFPSGIALHARTLEIAHPVKKETLTFTAPLPKAWEGVNGQDR
ncbi:MAG TPA: RluA family pseudouridine synthase [Pirellulaceae bacterium]|nr:RluA family pseudouridine synthase [Pirellulaceae bacterium]